MFSVEGQNKTLRGKIAEISSNLAVQPQSNETLEALKAQNESLRATIRAQTDALHSTDNASQTAERLLSENAVLKRKLQMAAQADDKRGSTQKDLMDLNQKLQAEIVKRDNYIKKVQQEMLKASAGGRDIAVSEERNASLEEALRRERENTVLYKSKIREYQQQIKALKSSSGKVDGVDDKLTVLQLENQTLKARLKLISQEASAANQMDSAELLNKKPEGSLVQYGGNDVNIEEGIGVSSSSNVTYIQTNYPKVDRVSPLLDEDGGHLFDKAGN